MKLCIIGNSHVAALKVALRDRLFDFPDLEVTFWGARGTTFFKVKYENGLLIPPNREIALLLSGGKHEQLNPQQFDAIAFHGPAVNYTRLLRSLCNAQHPHFFTTDFLRESIHDYLNNRPPCQIIRQVRADFNGPVLISPQPLILEQSKLFGELTITDAESEIICMILSDYFAQFGAEFVPQPKQTLADNHYTANKYFIRAGELRAAKDPDHDYVHMNADFGVEILRALCGRLKTDSRDSVRPAASDGSPLPKRVGVQAD